MRRNKICPKCGSQTLNLVCIDKSNRFCSDSGYEGAEIFIHEVDKVKEEFLKVDCQCCGYKWLMKTDETVENEYIDFIRSRYKKMQKRKYPL